MNPPVQTVLGGLARSVLMDLAPELKTPFAQQTAQLGAMLAMMIAQEFDRAAARLAEENAALAALFAAARDHTIDAELCAELGVAAAESPASLRVSDLHEHNKRLRALLIRLHAHVEELAGTGARGLEKRIWAELVESTRRRHLDLAVE